MSCLTFNITIPIHPSENFEILIKKRIEFFYCNFFVIMIE